MDIIRWSIVFVDQGWAKQLGSVCINNEKSEYSER